MSDIKNQRLFVLVGIPGSGKSTLALGMLDKLGDNTVYVSRDSIRNELGDKVFNRKSEDLVYKSYICRIATSLKMGHDVIADSTNLTKEKRYIYFAICEMLKSTKSAYIDTVGIFMSTPLSICLERNSKRCIDSKVPNNVLESMHSKIEEPSYDEGFKVVMCKN